jgi:hypothetical protein
MRNARSQRLVAGSFTSGVEDLEAPCEATVRPPRTAGTTPRSPGCTTAQAAAAPRDRRGSARAGQDARSVAPDGRGRSSVAVSVGRVPADTRIASRVPQVGCRAEASGFLVGPPVFKTGVGAKAPRRVRFPSASAACGNGLL